MIFTYFVIFLNFAQLLLFYLLLLQHSETEALADVTKSLVRVVNADAAVRKESFRPERVGGQGHVTLYRPAREQRVCKLGNIDGSG